MSREVERERAKEERGKEEKRGKGKKGNSRGQGSFSSMLRRRNRSSFAKDALFSLLETGSMGCCQPSPPPIWQHSGLADAERFPLSTGRCLCRHSAPRTGVGWTPSRSWSPYSVEFLSSCLLRIFFPFPSYRPVSFLSSSFFLPFTATEDVLRRTPLKTFVSPSVNASNSRTIPAELKRWKGKDKNGAREGKKKKKKKKKQKTNEQVAYLWRRAVLKMAIARRGKS